MMNIDDALGDAHAMSRITSIVSEYHAGSKTNYACLMLIQHILNKALKGVKTVKRWTSVRDKLPPEDFAVLIIDDHYEQFVGWLKDGKWNSSDCCECLVYEVTHWRDLPPEPACSE